MAAHASLDVRALSRAYAVKLRRGEFFSHSTALVLAGAELPSGLSVEVHVSAVRPIGRPRGRGVVGHEASVGSVRVVLIAGLPLAHPADAWCQLAEGSGLRELVIVGDALTRRKRPITNAEELRSAVDRWAGRRGARRLREALELLRPGTDSLRETPLRLGVIERGLPEPEVNGVIRDGHGRLVAYGDLVFRAFRVIFEYDGEHHRTDDVQYARDVDRLDDLARLGWRVIRVNKQHRGRALDERYLSLREALIERGWRPE